MQVIEYWEVYWNDSMGGGFGSSRRHIGYFSDKKVAEKVSKGKGEFGKDADVKHHQIIIFDSEEDMDEKKKQDIRERAIGKLTLEERAVLGLVL